MKTIKTLLVVSMSLLLGMASPTVQAGAPRSNIQSVGVDSFDSIFQEARTIDQALLGAQHERKIARRKVNNSLSLDPNTPFPTALRTLSERTPGTLQLAVHEGIPALQSSGVLPAEVQNTVSAVNEAVTRYHNILQQLVQIPASCQRLVQAVGQLNIDRLRSELSIKTPEDAVAHLRELSAYQQNVMAIIEMPERSVTLVQNLKADLEAITSIFAEVKQQVVRQPGKAGGRSLVRPVDR